MKWLVMDITKMTFENQVIIMLIYHKIFIKKYAK